MYDLANFDHYDVLGHLTYAQRYIVKTFGPQFELRRFEEKIRAILGRVIANGRGIEINTSGLRQGLGFTMPDYWVAGIYRELGGEILTVGSDAHYPEHVGANIPEVTEALREIGFRYLTVFRERKPVMVPIG